jgi:hypothetical protein
MLYLPGEASNATAGENQQHRYHFWQNGVLPVTRVLTFR